MRLLLLCGLLLLLGRAAEARPVHLLPERLASPVGHALFLLAAGDNWSGAQDGWTRSPPTPGPMQLRKWGAVLLAGGAGALLIGTLLVVATDGPATSIAGTVLLGVGGLAVPVGAVLLTAGLVVRRDEEPSVQPCMMVLAARF